MVQMGKNKGGHGDKPGRGRRADRVMHVLVLFNGMADVRTRFSLLPPPSLIALGLTYLCIHNCDVCVSRASQTMFSAGRDDAVDGKGEWIGAALRFV